MSRRIGVASFLVVSLSVGAFGAACSSTGSGVLGSGGSVSPGMGGASGGSTPAATGGAVASGGAVATGGSSIASSGGMAPASGGAASGGTSSASSGGASGGVTQNGGAAVGGQATTGGSSAAGGSPGTAGSLAGGASSGGTSAAGGSNGGSGGSGAGGGTSSGKGFFSDDFEAGTDGMQPPGWENFIGYVKNGANPSSDKSGLVLVDSTRAHSGKKSLHVKGGSTPAMATKALPNGTKKVYVRAWFYMTRKLGQNPGANHETLISLRKDLKGANDEVRFGEIKGVIGTNEVPSDNISPKMDMWGKGPVVAANTWACIEVAFLGDTTPNKLQAWADGTLVHEVTAPDQWQNGMLPANWLDGKFLEVGIGWQSFSSASNELWIDDVVLSDSKIGCN